MGRVQRRGTFPTTRLPVLTEEPQPFKIVAEGPLPGTTSYRDNFNVYVSTSLLAPTSVRNLSRFDKSRTRLDIR